MTGDIVTADSARGSMTKEQWLAVRKEAALQIDPETAEVYWEYAQMLDPYGVHDLHDLPEEGRCVGRVYFACSPGSAVWVWFGDLPDATCDRLQERLRAGEFDFTDDSWLFDEPEP
jgi:hypothetical protein